MTATPTAFDLTTGLTTALWYAVPDYTESRSRRAIARAGVLAGGSALSFLAQPDLLSSDEEDPAPDPATDPGAEVDEEPTESPLRTALVLGAAAATVVSVIAFERSVPKVAERLRERGVRRPNLVIGLTLGALTTLAGPAMRSLEETLADR